VSQFIVVCDRSILILDTTYNIGKQDAAIEDYVEFKFRPTYLSYQLKCQNISDNL
jgi:hypothetical protein